MPTYPDLKAFELGQARRARTFVQDATKVYQAAILAAARVAIMETPVDEGRARNGWSFTYERPPNGDAGRGVDPSGESATNRAKNHADRAKLGAIAWAHNGVPYVPYLNDGTERSRAFAMAEKAVEAARRVIRGARFR